MTLYVHRQKRAAWYILVAIPAFANVGLRHVEVPAVVGMAQGLVAVFAPLGVESTDMGEEPQTVLWCS